MVAGVPGHLDREPPDGGTGAPPRDVVREGHLLRQELHPQQVVLRDAPGAQPAGQKVRKGLGEGEVKDAEQGC